ncbi:hypothetical protein [Burkholderia cepacia]|uniref:hypothetical protein n=1 Tax=Burkholderia cepacia TaxID=292 RepID=UPI00299044BD|nr:hypothetical protein [Burkholderia cepacia]
MSTVKPGPNLPDQQFDSIELSNLARTFDRFTSTGSESISGVSASIHLNQFNKSFQAIDSIARILLANEVARDSVEPVLSGYLVGGLLTAVQTLAEVSVRSLDNLADWCDQREQEMSHG